MLEAARNGRGVFLRHPSQYLRRNKLKSISGRDGETSPALSGATSIVVLELTGIQEDERARRIALLHFHISRIAYILPLYYNISLARVPSVFLVLVPVVSLAYIIDLNDISSFFPPHLHSCFALREA